MNQPLKGRKAMNNKRPLRLHWSVILEESIGTILGILAIFIYNTREIITALNEYDWNISKAIASTNMGSVDFQIIVLIFFSIIILVLVYRYVSWRNTFISFSEGTIILEKGKINHRKLVISTDTIASINIRKSIFQRLAGTSQLKIDLNEMSPESPKFKIILKNNDARQFREQILLGGETPHKAGNPDRKSLISFNWKALLQHYLLDMNIILALGAIALYIFITISSFMDLRALSVVSFFFASLVIVVPFLYRGIKKFYALGNFSVYREGETIFLSYGILEQSSYELSVKRINAVRILQSLQAQLFHKYCIEVVNAGLGDEKEESKIITLYVDRQTLDYLMEELLPEFFLDHRPRRQKFRAIWVHILPLTIFTGILIAASILISYWLLCIIVLFAVLFILNMRFKTLQVNESLLLIGNGIFTKSTTIIPADRIQKINTRQTWITKPLHLMAMDIFVVGTSISTGFFGQEAINHFMTNKELYE